MSHGKRYSAKDRKEILTYLETHTYQETMGKFKVSQMSLARWVKNKEKRETNTVTPLLTQELQNELKIYLSLIENSESVTGAAVLTVAGELIVSKLSGFNKIFSDIYDVARAVSNLLLCAQGFTAVVVNDVKNVGSKFDNISINTPIGTFFVTGVGQAVLVTLYSLEITQPVIFEQDYQFVSRIKDQITEFLKKNLSK